MRPRGGFEDFIIRRRNRNDYGTFTVVRLAIELPDNVTMSVSKSELPSIAKPPSIANRV